MDNDSIVEQIVRSLSFEVEAIPQDNIIQVNTTSKSAPLNVKIRVRKKEEAGFQHGVLSLPKPHRPDGVPERIRLVSSDQTIMSFDVVMEADFEKPVRKPRKNVFGVFKPTICLGAQPDEDEYAYLPSTTYKAEMNEESSSKSEGALKKFTLQKNEESNNTSATGPKRNKNLFGKCKPGGCLDPPFSDDRDPYLPAILNEQITTPVLVPEETDQTVGQTSKNKTRTSSIFSNKLLNWKRKNDAHDALENNVIKKETKAESVLDLYQAGSLQTSTTFSNSIMTYPSTLNSSEHRIQEEKQRASEIYNDSLKNTYNVPSGNYFTVPKMMKNIVDKNKIENTLDIEDKGDISHAKTDMVNPKFESKDVHDNFLSQDLVDGQKKHVLRTKDSVTDVRGAEKYFMESKHSKESSTFETDFEGNSTTDLASPKLHIPVLTKTERIGLDNMQFEEDQTQNIKIKVLTLPSSPAKISMMDIPDVIERISMRAAQNKDNVIKSDRNEIIQSPNFIDKVQLPGEIKDKQEQIHDLNLFDEKQLPEYIENVGKIITVPPKSNAKIENIWTLPNTDTSNMLGSPESTKTEDFDDKHDFHTDASLRTEVKKSENLINHSSIEQICDLSPATEFQTNNRWSEEQKKIKSINTPLKQTSSASNISVEKFGSDDENKYDSKSIVTLETKQELKDELTGSASNVGVVNSKAINYSGSDAVLKPKYEIIPPKQNDENKNDTQSIETFEKKQELKEEQTSSASNISMVKSKPVNYSESDAVFKYENIPPIQNDENKNDTKSIETLETKQKLKDENKITIKDLGDDVSSDILAKRDAPLETTHTDGDDIQHLLKNKDHPLEKDAFIENKFNQQLGSNYKYNDTLDSFMGQKSSDKISNEIDKNNIQKSENLNGLMVNAEFEKDLQENNVLKNSQFKSSLPQSGNIEQTALLEGDSHKMNTQMNEIDSAASNLQDSLFVRKITSTLVMAESNKATDPLDVTHPVSPLKETIELTQTKAFSEKNDVNGKSGAPFSYEIMISADGSFNKLNTEHINNIDINELGNNKINAESKESSLKNHEEKIENNFINYNMENITLQGPQPNQNKDIQQSQDEMGAKKQTYQIKENNKADAKHITFYGEAKVGKDFDLDSTVERKNSYLESAFNLYAKADPNTYLDLEAMESKSLEMNGFDKRFSGEHHSNQAQVILDRKAPFKISLAIQSYVNENNEVIVKSFDADKIPKRYPNDTVRITKRSLEINDEIIIPIDSENNLSILIKCNKQKDISEVVGHSLDTGMTRENKLSIACVNDGNPVKRNVRIADDIQKTLLTVYEDELLPLRNTISELTEHMKILTSQHMLLKGYGLVKKPRSRRIVPLYGKCGCIRRCHPGKVSSRS